MGERVAFVKCDDGHIHRYLNADTRDLDQHPPTSQPRCEYCGHAYSQLRTSGELICNECAWELVAINAHELAEQIGVPFLGAPSHHAEL